MKLFSLRRFVRLSPLARRLLLIAIDASLLPLAVWLLACAALLLPVEAWLRR